MSVSAVVGNFSRTRDSRKCGELRVSCGVDGMVPKVLPKPQSGGLQCAAGRSSDRRGHRSQVQGSGGRSWARSVSLREFCFRPRIEGSCISLIMPGTGGEHRGHGSE